ncbi:MAG: hypothetical protein ABIK83_07080 [Candidatus Zixiibacteriota bacterium]
MKTAFFILTILVLFGTYSTADAQFGKIITLGGGISSVQKPDSFSDYYKRGYNGSAALGFGIVPGVSIHAMIEFSSFPLDADKIEENASRLGIKATASGDGLTAISGFILARVRVMLLAPGSSPYAIGGVGLVRAGVSNIELAAEDPLDNITIRLESETATAITVGAGFDFGFAPKTSIFFEGRYVRAFFKDDNFAYIPIKAGLNISL